MSTSTLPSAVPSDPAALQKLENRARWTWTSIVVGLLSLQITVGISAVYLATNDPSFAVVPDYEQQAMQWDTSTANQLASDQLGWSCDIEIGQTTNMLGQRHVSMTLKDDTGALLSDALVDVTMFPLARANQVTSVTMSPQTDGVYEKLCEMRQHGLWEIRLVAKRGDQTFISGQRIELSKPKGQGTWQQY